MAESESATPQPIAPERSASKRRATIVGLGLVLILLAAWKPEPIRAAWAKLERIIQLKSDPLPASPAKLSDHEIEELAVMTPQKQAERLIERAINHYEGAIELIDKYKEGWYGGLNLEGQLSGLLMSALNSNDLRVRAASLEIYLAAYNLPKRPESAETLLQRIQDERESRPWALWMLGALANRGVEPERATATLLDYLRDPNEQTRYWAVEGLALAGSDATIQPLLQVFHDDASMQVRERAACSLAQSGMLTKDQRMTAVPDLLRFMDDPTLDATVRGWVFQALRDITGTSIGADPAAWRNWWAQYARG